MSDANLNDPQIAADYDLIYADWDAHVDRLVQIMNGQPNGRAGRDSGHRDLTAGVREADRR
jgi:hypothetical protein